MNPSTALPMRRESFPGSPSHVLLMFNFSANHLTLLSRTEYRALSLWLPQTEGPWVFPSRRNTSAPIQDFGKAFEKAARGLAWQVLLRTVCATRS